MKLKYRVWDKKANKYLDKTNWFCLYMDGDYGSDPVNIFQKGPDDNFVVQFWTGLYDTDEKEIYDGDIVRFSRWNSPKKELEDYLCDTPKKIVWGLRYGQFPDVGFCAISLSPADLEDGHTLNWMDARNITIIGNIYENPELLK